ncbi:hypothetical protein ABVT39_003198 [Epinephelus coioides]
MDDGDLEQPTTSTTSLPGQQCGPMTQSSAATVRMDDGDLEQPATSTTSLPGQQCGLMTQSSAATVGMDYDGDLEQPTISTTWLPGQQCVPMAEVNHNLALHSAPHPPKQVHVENQTVRFSTCECPIVKDKCHHMAALLIWVEKNVSRTNVEYLWKRHFRLAAKPDRKVGYSSKLSFIQSIGNNAEWWYSSSNLHSERSLVFSLCSPGEAKNNHQTVLYEKTSLKAYKSLEGYKWTQYGFVINIQLWSLPAKDSVVVIGRVILNGHFCYYQTNGVAAARAH